MRDRIRCWAPAGCRPQVKRSVGAPCVRHGSVPPRWRTHQFDPAGSDRPAVSLFLAEASARHPDERLLMFSGPGRVASISGLGPIPVKPYGWPPPKVPSAFRVNNHHSHMNAAEAALVDRLCRLESSPHQIRLLTGFAWIINVILNAKQLHLLLLPAMQLVLPVGKTLTA